MNKKIFLTVIIYIIILINFLSPNVYGYSTSQYSIEVPNNYSQQEENYNKNNVTYCTECGNELLENHKFCWKCGNERL